MKLSFYHRQRFFCDDFPFFIERIRHYPGQHDEEKTRFRRDFWKVSYAVSGRGEFLINDRSRPFHEGAIALTHPDSETNYRIFSESIELYHILFLPSLIGDELARLENEFDFFSVFKPEEPSFSEFYVIDEGHGLLQVILDLLREFRRQEPNYRMMIRLRLTELLIAISRRGIRRFLKNGEGNLIGYIDHRIDNNFRDSFDLASLAAETGIGRTRLCQLYRRATGKTIMDTMRTRRLEEAERLLKETGLPIAEICFKTGFNDLSYFYRIFVRRTGMTPLTFRKKAIG